MAFSEQDIVWMQHALSLAQQAADIQEVPVGAVIVRDGQVLGQGYNRPISSHDPSAHAEIIALRDACNNAQNYRIPGSTLYVTLEPCSMCAGAIVHARVDRVVFGASEPKAGVVASQQHFFDQGFLNYRVAYEGGCMQQQCGELITAFFDQRRADRKREKSQKKED